jgi:serine/threonine-protein kinase
VTEVGSTIDGRFIVERRLGSGTSGEVFAARDCRDGHRLAIKLQEPRTFHSRKEFRKEGERVLVDLKHARNLAGIHGIPAFYGSGTHEDRQFVIMQLIEGLSLSQLLDRIKPVYTQFAACVLAQLCTTLSQVHGRGFLHRDIKPENVVVSWDGGVWLLDLGNAMSLHGDDFGKGGTHGYAPPEQYAAKAQTVQSDIYSLGATLFEMCVMRVPYEGHQGRPKKRTPQFPPELLDRMDSGLRELGLRMVAFNSDHRPADTSEVLAALETMLPRPGDTRHPKAPDPDPAEWYRHGRHLTHRTS